MQNPLIGGIFFCYILRRQYEFLFLLKTLIVGTRKNRLSEAALTSTHNLCFGAKIRKKYTPVNPNFTI